MSLRSSHQKDEGTLQVSKSRKIPLLISPQEMSLLFKALGSFELFDVSRPVDLESAKISREDFLNAYSLYIDGIKMGKLYDESLLRPFFSASMTTSSDLLYAQTLQNGKYLVKATRPVIQLQRHHFIYSDAFHSGVMGTGSITWGIQFSYPQLFLDPKTKSIGKVEKNEEFPNTELFHRLTKWVRKYTQPTPFVVDGIRINQPMRIGKECFSWIEKHPGLKKRGIHVERSQSTSKTS